MGVTLAPAESPTPVVPADVALASSDRHPPPKAKAGPPGGGATGAGARMGPTVRVTTAEILLWMAVGAGAGTVSVALAAGIRGLAVQNPGDSVSAPAPPSTGLAGETERGMPSRDDKR